MNNSSDEQDEGWGGATAWAPRSIAEDPSPLVLRKDPSCPVKTQSSPNTTRPQPGFVFHGIIYKAIQ